MSVEPKIIFQDNHILVVEKPVDVPSTADSSGDADLQGMLKAYLKKEFNKPGNVFLGVVHRLDRMTGGVMHTLQWRMNDCFRQQRFPFPGFGSEVTIALGTYMGVNAKGAESIAPAIKR